MTSLTSMDIKFLAEQPSAEARSILASKLVKDYCQNAFKPGEVEIVNDIFRILLKDVETIVRQQLADELAHYDNVPHDIIVALARDEEDVIALPVLRHSKVLTEKDLLAVIKSTKVVARWLAISKRDELSEKLSASLLKTGSSEVAKAVFSNSGALFSEQILLECWDTFEQDESVLEVMVKRGSLPLTIAEKLFFAVSDELKRQLATQYQFSAPSIRQAVTNVREWQMLGIMPAQSGLDPRDDLQIEDLVDDLHKSGRLTYSLLMRALCTGNLQLFEAGIAKLAGVPRVNARILLMDRGPLGFDAIYKASHMPEGFLDAVETLLRISFEETEYGRVRREDFRKRVVERIYKSQYHRTVENMDYVLSIIGGKIAASASIH